MKRTRKLGTQIHIAIALAVLGVMLIYSLIIFPFENQRREILINQIKVSINAVVAQREDELANQIF